MKKFLSAFLAAVLTLGLVSCKPNPTDQTTASTTASSTNSDTQKPEQPNVNAVFDESKIVFSFAAISDIHIGRDTNNVEENKFKSALLQLKEQAAKHDADGIDAVLAVGDLFEGSGYGGTNTSGNINSYKQIYQSVFNPAEVPMIHAEGNHDLTWDSTAKNVAAEHNAMFGPNFFLTDVDKDALAAEGNRHCVVNGYHILTLLPVTSTNVSYTQGTKNWLDKTLSEITTADPDAYVIVLTHPMIYDTVYGSTLGREPGTSLTDMWATSDLTPILSKYNQVVTFGGHLHFPINDPRTIMQTSFTSLGCGSVNYMAIEDGKYENMASATTMKDNTEYSQGLLCQIDENGNMRITRMDFYNKAAMEPWEISHPTADGSHLTKYGKDRGNAENNQAPALSGIEAIMGTPSATGKQSVTIQFDAATDDTFAHHYTMEFKKAGKTRRTFNILSDFYRVSDPAQMKKSLSHSLGSLSPDDYEVILTAYDSWGAASEPISFKFTVAGVTE
ncbi:MAG: metallophosphoesterase [Clostridia bacterium]|nr:metallophosphoesterase [Clostridia bacterium]